MHQRNSTAALLLIALGGLTLASSCLKEPNQYDPTQDPNLFPAGSGGRGAVASLDGPTRPPQSETQPTDGPPPTPDPVTATCPEGFHLCGTECADNKSPETCGVSCQACATITGGTATCDGTRCGVSCPAGQKACLDSCIPEGSPLRQRLPRRQEPVQRHLRPAHQPQRLRLLLLPLPLLARRRHHLRRRQVRAQVQPRLPPLRRRLPQRHETHQLRHLLHPLPRSPPAATPPATAPSAAPTAPQAPSSARAPASPTTRPATASAPSGQRDCNGNCVPNNDVNFCGPTCTSCGARDNADARCENNACAYTCRNGFHKCGETCRDNRSIDTCGTRCDRCPAPANSTPSCDGTNCNFTCNPGFYRCGDACIARTQACNGSCPDGLRACGTTCVEGNCCNNGDCDNFACQSNRCSTTHCAGGFTKCGNNCTPNNQVPQEQCNGRDDNCNGPVDEGILGRELQQPLRNGRNAA